LRDVTGRLHVARFLWPPELGSPLVNRDQKRRRTSVRLGFSLSLTCVKSGDFSEARPIALAHSSGLRGKTLVADEARVGERGLSFSSCTEDELDILQAAIQGEAGIVEPPHADSLGIFLKPGMRQGGGQEGVENGEVDSPFLGEYVCLSDEFEQTSGEKIRQQLHTRRYRRVSAHHDHLCSIGLKDALREAACGLLTIYWYTVGFTIEEQAVYPRPGERNEQYDLAKRAERIDAERFPLALAAGEEAFSKFDERFEQGLRMIIRGLRT
jgi:Tetracyclin repressor-like, C-terminal domain